MFGVIKTRQSGKFEYSDHLPDPTPGKGEVLVKVESAAVCATDRHILDWTPWAQTRVKLPLVPGHEISGTIIDLGSGAHGRIGARVALESHIPCGRCDQCFRGNRHLCDRVDLLGATIPGGFAQYVAIADSCVHELPDGLTFRKGALLEPFGAAVHGVDRADVDGKTVLVTGCGPIGLMAVGAARAFGATTIIATEPKPERRRRALLMGADHVFDSRNLASGDLLDALGSAGFDVAINCSDDTAAVLTCIRSVRKGGTVVSVGLPQNPITLDLSEELLYREITLAGISGRMMPRTWDQCFRLLDEGLVDLTPVLGFDHALADANAAVEDTRAGLSGKPTISINAKERARVSNG